MTDTIPQDTSLPDDVVERVAKIAIDDMAENSLGYYVDADNLDRCVLDGRFDMLRLVRVISAALKAEG